MTECQGCGAWNDRSRTRCVLCGTPLGEIDEWEATDDLPPLPPLPDGGLATTMPSWLRDLPTRAATIADPPGIEPAPAPATPPPAPKAIPERVTLPTAPHAIPPALPPLGANADPRTFLTEDDFPRWLHLLAAQQAARIPSPAPVPEVSVNMAAAESVAAGADWPRHVAPELPPAATVPPVEVAVILPPDEDARPELAAMPPPDQPRRVRSSWETLLLIVLFIGLVVAAVWALVVNGVLSPPATP